MVTKRERVLRSLRHQPPDFTPWHIDFTIPIQEKLVRHYALSDAAKLEEKIGNHFCCVGPNLALREIEKDLWQDAYGVIWDRRVDKDIGNPINCLLLDKNSLQHYKFPTLSEEIFAHIPGILKAHPDCFKMFSFGFSFFERAWTLRGMENVLTDMITDPGFVKDLFSRILRFNLSLIEKALTFPVDAVCFGDDWGHQQGLLMGPRLWRKFIKPGLAQMYQKVKEQGKFVAIHSCGKVDEILPDLIEIGVDLFNPFQPEVMDVRAIKRTMGNKISFWGGLSTQKALPYFSTQDLKAEIKRLISELGKNGGYVFAPAHAVPKDVPLKNVLTMIETLHQQPF